MSKNNQSPDLLLLQLPLIYSNFEIKEKYIPLSLCYLFSQITSLRPEIKADIIHFPQTCLSDDGLLKLIIQKNPGAIGFSCYVWNFERTLYFAGQIKRHLPEVKIILGGPEISDDNRLAFNDAVDLLVFGEGEEAIVKLVDSIAGTSEYSNVANIAYRKNDEFIFTKKKLPDEDLNLDSIDSPYAPKLLEKLGEINYAFLESRRGCPYRCAYCFYGKGINNSRSFSIDRVMEEFLTIKSLGTIRTVYFIDSCINSNPDFKKIMSNISKINCEPKIEIQIEARAELIDSEQVELMKKANVVTVEVGLQSYNQKTLNEINRQTDFKKFEKGVKLLTANGIGVIIGSIHGLPLDDVNSIKRTVDYVINTFPEADKHFYPLCVLPSTKIRGQAEKWGINYQTHPPYLILSNTHINSEQLYDAFRYSDKAVTDLLDSFPLLTFYSGTSNSNLNEISIGEISELELVSRLYFEETIATYKLIDGINNGQIEIKFANSLVMYFKTDNQNIDNFITFINKLLIKVYEKNPYLVINLILELPVIRKQDLINILDGIVRKRGFLDYMNLYNEHSFKVKKKDDSTNASLQLFKVGAAGLKPNMHIKPISQVFFDDFDIKDNDLNVIDKERGYLVETDEPLPDKKFFQNLRREISEDKIACFKNLTAQKIWDEIINKGATNLPLGEHAIISTDNIKIAYFDKNEITLDAAEWLILNKKESN